MIKKILLIVLALLWASPAFAAYSYVRTITIDHTKVGTVNNTDQTSFPIEVCANGASPCNTSIAGLNQSGAGAHVQNSSGFDIGFFTDSGCTTKVTAWEVETYVPSTGELEAWVNDGTLSHTVDTTFYMCYGDASISTFQSTASSVWDSSYKAVYHLPDGTTLSMNDSTSNVNNSTNTGTTATAGQIDGAAAFDGSSHYFTTPISNVAYTNGSIEWWMRPSLVYNNGTIQGIWASNDGVTSDFGAQNFSDGNMYIGWNTPPHDDRIVVAASSANWPQNTWIHYAYVWSNGGTGYLYANGVQIGSHAVTGSVNAATNFVVGYENPAFIAATSFTGRIDEFKISNTARSTDWISTEYNNQNAPSTFETYGTEGTPGGGGSTFTAHGFVSLMKGMLTINSKSFFIIN